MNEPDYSDDPVVAPSSMEDLKSTPGPVEGHTAEQSGHQNAEALEEAEAGAAGRRAFRRVPGEQKGEAGK